MLGGSTEQEGAACGGIERDPQQDELGLPTLIGFSIFPWQTQADRIVTLGGSSSVAATSRSRRGRSSAFTRHGSKAGRMSGGIKQL